MATVSNITQAIQQIAAGKAQHLVAINAAAGVGTAGVASCGFFSLSLAPNYIGTTIPTTLQSFEGVQSPTSNFRHVFLSSAGTATTIWLVNLYLIGTVSFTSTGNQFTHNAATFPVLRTKYGQASQPVNLIPLLYVTTATTGTAPAFILETSTGGTGYVNQAGSNVVGTKTFTLPSATTAAGSCYILRLEDGDCGIQDIKQINITSAGTAGAASLYGMEKICPAAAPVRATTVQDGLLGGIMSSNFLPAVATSGTAGVLTTIMLTANTSAQNVAYDIAIRSNI